MTVVYVDMDDVLCDYTSEYKRALLCNTSQKYPQSVPRFFQDLSPIPGAIAAVNELRELCEVYVLSAPSTRNPHSYTEKRLWIEQNFDYEFTKRLILSPNKSLLKGDYLVDDRATGKGQENFEGRLILFGSEEFSDWSKIISYLKCIGITKP